MSKRQGPLVLCIMDGFGYMPFSYESGITKENSKHLYELFEKYPFITLEASHHYVGLPDGQMGNSEVGHMNIGTGQILLQSLLKINMAIKDNSFKDNQALKTGLKNAEDNNSNVHLMGLYSDGGVHSLDEHFRATIDFFKNGKTNVYLHLFTDGRDTKPTVAANDIKKLQKFLTNYPNVKIASIAGRYYAMDRDKNWDRMKLAYDAWIANSKITFNDPVEYLNSEYKKDILDEFITPAWNANIRAKISAHDTICIINFRPDRVKQLASLLTDPNCKTNNEINDVQTNITFITMTDYDKDIKANIMFPADEIKSCLGEVLAEKKKRQLRIAETEKYAHVTFFFDGGAQVSYPLEKKILIPSPKVKTFDLQPEMSAYEITSTLIKELPNTDVVILNFANCDMVGHTGNYEAAVKAVATIDECVYKIYEKLQELDGTLMITADHGNVDHMRDLQGHSDKMHTTNVVPFCITDSNIEFLTKKGKLADISGSILYYLGIKKPECMEKSIIRFKERKYG